MFLVFGIHDFVFWGSMNLCWHPGSQDSKLGGGCQNAVLQFLTHAHLHQQPRLSLCGFVDFENMSEPQASRLHPSISNRGIPNNVKCGQTAEPFYHFPPEQVVHNVFSWSLCSVMICQKQEIASISQRSYLAVKRI